MQQVLVKVRRPRAETAEEALRAILRTLDRERTLDSRVAFNLIGSASLIALVAPADVIERVRDHPDVVSVTADMPQDALGDFRLGPS
jgi:hypothetical protein